VNYSDHTCRLRSPFSRLETETVIHSDSDFATVAFLRIRRVSFDPKTEQSPDIAVPALLDYPYRRVMEDIQARFADDDDRVERVQTPSYPDWALGTQLPVPMLRRMENWIAISNVHRDSRDTSDMLLEDEIRACFQVLQSKCWLP